MINFTIKMVVIYTQSNETEIFERSQFNEELQNTTNTTLTFPFSIVTNLITVIVQGTMIYLKTAEALMLKSKYNHTTCSEF